MVVWPVEQVLMWLGYGLCHQLPQRSFFGGTYQVPVCARDTGIYIGFVLSLALLATLSRGRRPSAMPSAGVLVLVAASVAFLGWDGVTSYAGWRETTNELRLLTGLLMGWALPAILLPMLNGQLWRSPSTGRVPAGAIQTAAWLAPVPVVYLVVLRVLPLLGAAYAVLVAAAIIATFVIVNLAAVSILPFAENRAERLRDAWPALLLALAFSGVEIAASAWLRWVLVGLVPGGR
jgi:uncharacterized membrane protein